MTRASRIADIINEARYRMREREITRGETGMRDFDRVNDKADNDRNTRTNNIDNTMRGRMAQHIPVTQPVYTPCPYCGGTIISRHRPY